MVVPTARHARYAGGTLRGRVGSGAAQPQPTQAYGGPGQERPLHSPGIPMTRAISWNWSRVNSRSATHTGFSPARSGP